MREHPVLSSILVLAIAASPVWAKPKTKIIVKVVSTKPEIVHAPIYNPGTSGSATTNCMPDGGPCDTTVRPGQPASVTDLPLYNEYVYAVMPGDRHVTLQCWGFMVVCRALQPGNYDAETDGGKVLLLHVRYPDPRNPNSGKPGKLKYRIVGTW